MAVAFALLVATACEARDGSAAKSKPDRYVRAAVDATVLCPSDAPRGTAYVDGVAGYQDLQAFARDDVELARLEAVAFQIGHLALCFPACIE